MFSVWCTAGRVHRLGQTKDVTVHRIVVKQTVEMSIREIARRRQAMCVSSPQGASDYCNMDLILVPRQRRTQRS